MQKVVVSTLQNSNIFVRDNLVRHKSSATSEAIRKVGARPNFPPPYCPSLNTVERFFAKLKHLPRKDKERSEEEVNDRIGTIIRVTSKAESQNCIRNAEYVPVKFTPV